MSIAYAIICVGGGLTAGILFSAAAVLMKGPDR